MQMGLYIVGTPIGNLGDMSQRAIETLQNADLIVCEDTRVFGKLAAHFDIKTNKMSFHEHNENEKIPELVEKIKSGGVIAITTDAGMPCISDPGFRLVRALRDAKLPVYVVPGPTAVISGLVLSGFPTDRFTFCGFFDDKKVQNDNKIRHTIIYYESPNRILKTIAVLAQIMPERRIAIVREITKMFEETIIGYPAELMHIQPPKGEIVIVIEPAPDVKMSDLEISEIVNDVYNSSTKSGASEVAARSGISKKQAYKKLLENKND
jgi:16S rRNA (cytidine1402-2'-O)-methyltransferase